MTPSICGSDCCAACPQKAACGGCLETQGHPFGGSCVAAARISREGPEAFADWKRATIAELNALNLPDLHLQWRRPEDRLLQTAAMRSSINS